MQAAAPGVQTETYEINGLRIERPFRFSRKQHDYHVTGSKEAIERLALHPSICFPVGRKRGATGAIGDGQRWFMIKQIGKPLWRISLCLNVEHAGLEAMIDECKSQSMFRRGHLRLVSSKGQELARVLREIEESERLLEVCRGMVDMALLQLNRKHIRAAELRRQM